MKNRKSKTALSKRFPRLNTTLKAIQNLTRSQWAKVGQIALILVGFGLGLLAMIGQNLPSLFGCIVALGGAFVLERYRN